MMAKLNQAVFGTVLLLSMSLVSAEPLALVIHGGAGTLRQTDMSPEQQAEYRASLTAALSVGREILEAEGSALDAVVATVRVLEDDPRFNAGRGAVFSAEGRNELDASLMDGSNRQAGAIAGVTGVRHPIELARAVMEHSPHVMLSGSGAEAFARERGLEFKPAEYFHTEFRRAALDTAQQRERERQQADAPSGTVGALALDSQGRLAAATSTGGMTNKRWGRIGDSPLIGAGTWADGDCAVSATGHGEYFIRKAVAHEICARSRYTDASVSSSAQAVIDELAAEGGDGGVIVLDAQGDFALVFNTSGMYRGSWSSGSALKVELFDSEAQVE